MAVIQNITATAVIDLNIKLIFQILNIFKLQPHMAPGSNQWLKTLENKIGCF